MMWFWAILVLLLMATKNISLGEGLIMLGLLDVVYVIDKEKKQ